MISASAVFKRNREARAAALERGEMSDSAAAALSTSPSERRDRKQRADRIRRDMRAGRADAEMQFGGPRSRP